MSNPYNLSMALLHVRAELERVATDEQENSVHIQEIYKDLVLVFRRLTNVSNQSHYQALTLKSSSRRENCG